MPKHWAGGYMSANEIVTVTQQYRERIRALLTPHELADFDAYEQRVQAQIDAGNPEPIEPTPVEHAIITKIAADARAAALHKQLMVLLRIETLPQ
jgi:hypothetical protein